MFGLRAHVPPPFRTFAAAPNQSLKQALEDAAGTPLPRPGWRAKVLAALEANPALKQKVTEAREAVAAGPRRERRSKAAQAVLKSLGLVAVVACLSLFLGPAGAIAAALAVAVAGLVACCLCRAGRAALRRLGWATAAVAEAEAAPSGYVAVAVPREPSGPAVATPLKPGPAAVYIVDVEQGRAKAAL